MKSSNLLSFVSLKNIIYYKAIKDSAIFNHFSYAIFGCFQFPEKLAEKL